MSFIVAGAVGLFCAYSGMKSASESISKIDVKKTVIETYEDNYISVLKMRIKNLRENIEQINEEYKNNVKNMAKGCSMSDLAKERNENVKKIMYKIEKLQKEISDINGKYKQVK